MRLEHEFTVPVPADSAWRILLDLPVVAPCMPGATLTSYDGAEFTGTVKVKVGPISLTYKGKGRVVESDETARRAVVEASGRESRGAGTAKATVTATLHPEGDSTRVAVATDLAITGRPAQFGRGMMTDVGSKLIGQFAECLAGKLERGEVASRDTSAPATEPDGPAEVGTGTGPSSADAEASAGDSAAGESAAGESAAGESAA
ncbi:MAG TPA: SRPBCC family protein, partial [Actinopolymorphaceae bacterium]|nr:SRPBCC family protein [Actinopolymorphaceae bacterium]